jgi:hypothetical protein
MDKIEHFKRFAETARNEEPPRTDVAQAVMARIKGVNMQTTENVLVFDRTLAYAAGFAAAAALIAAFATYPALGVYDVPWVSWLSSFDFFGSM